MLLAVYMRCLVSSAVFLCTVSSVLPQMMQHLKTLSVNLEEQMPSLSFTFLHGLINKPLKKLCCLQPRPQPRSAIPTSSQGRLVLPGQAQLPRVRSMQIVDGYAPDMQPRRSEQTYVAAAAPARQAHTDNVRCSVRCFLSCMHTGMIFDAQCICLQVASVQPGQTMNAK